MARKLVTTISTALRDFELSSDIEQSELKRYTLYLNEWTAEELKRLNGEISLLENQPDQNTNRYIDALSDNYFYVSASLKRILFNSSLVTCFSYVESKQKELCELYLKYSNSKIKLKDLSGSGDFEKAIKFYKKVIGVEFSDEMNALYKNLMAFKDLRNLIVHHNSVLVSHKEKLIRDCFKNFILSRDIDIVNDVIFIRNHLLSLYLLDQGNLLQNAIIEKILKQQATSKK